MWLGQSAMNGMLGFTVGGTLRRTFDIVRRQAGTLVSLAVVFYVLPVAVLELLTKLAFDSSATVPPFASAAGPIPPPTTGILLGFGALAGLVAVLGGLLVTASAVWVSYEEVCDRPAKLSGGADRALRALPANLAMAVVMSVALTVGFLLLVVPGIILMLRWSAALPALVVEKAGVMGSLGRSRDLTSGHRWGILGVVAVLALIEVVIAVVIGLGSATLAVSLLGSRGALITDFVTVPVNGILSAFNGAAIAVLYVELRRAREGGLAEEAAEAFA